VLVGLIGARVVVEQLATINTMTSTQTSRLAHRDGASTRFPADWFIALMPISFYRSFSSGSFFLPPALIIDWIVDL
jgi:hypothetical protein